MRTRHSWQRRLMGVMCGLALLATPMVAGAVCGDGLPDPGEQCDPGPDIADDCCTAGCQITSAAPAFVCRPIADLCDVAEVCDGVTTACPADVTEPNGTACDDGAPCSVPDTCQGGVCQAGSVDGDGDTVCDADDNCPGAANAGQADLDGDSIGDVCDPSDAPLNPIKVQIRLNGAPAPRDNSLAKAKGDFVTIAPGDVFGATAPITLTIGDGKALPTTRTFTWQPANCRTVVRGVTCTSPDRNHRASFRTSPKAPGVWKFRAAFKKTNITGSLQPPAVATLTYGPSTDRTGVVTDCKQSFANDSGITCRDAN